MWTVTPYQLHLRIPGGKYGHIYIFSATVTEYLPQGLQAAALSSSPLNNGSR
uniref:Uncharacterized protein n=1 Tax=Anguilla anguilla TaxID=7936 RepID=A0A0E9S697_ANGAN